MAPICVRTILGRNNIRIYLPQDCSCGAGGGKRKRQPAANHSTLSASPGGTETVFWWRPGRNTRSGSGILEAEGYTVLCAVDGNDALRVAGEYKEQIHLLVRMFHAQHWRPGTGPPADSAASHMKVLFMSGYPEHASQGDETVDQSVPVLLKPFLLDTLAHTLRDVLATTNPANNQLAGLPILRYLR